VAGALYVPQVGIINPSEFSPANSIEAVIWVAVGGRGTLTGAVIGAIAVNYAKTFFTSGTLLPYWVLGGCVVILVAVLSIRRRETLIGAGAGLVVAGLSLLLSGSLIAVYVLAGTLIAVAMARSWHPMVVGAILGVLAAILFWEPTASIGLAPFWLFALGGLFVAVTLLLPRGIVGTWQHWSAQRRERMVDGAVPGGEPAPASASRPAE
jgi:ABC-type branched-subunit amino acid transport system permease subunit